MVLVEGLRIFWESTGLYDCSSRQRSVETARQFLKVGAENKWQYW